jgi:TonB family protein
MRRLLITLFLALLPALLRGQATQAPQSARQALIDMFFGTSADHLEKHLPDATRKTLKKLDSGEGTSMLAQLSMFSAMAKTGGVNLQTFETGPVLVSVDQPERGAAEHVEITVERDDLMGDEDQLELALHITKNGKEQSLPFVPRFTFSMKSEADVWRLNEISVTARVPLSDPDFLKTIEDKQRAQNEQMTIWSLRTVSESEKGYAKANGGYACTLSALGKRGANAQVLWDAQLASGKKGGYIYAISSCDASHYKVVAEPAVSDSGQRAFCSDEGGTIRAAKDGKATTCLSSGEAVEEERLTGLGATAVGVDSPRVGATVTYSEAPTAKIASSSNQQAPPVSATAAVAKPTRIRASQGVMGGLLVKNVQPQYPTDAKAARVQGAVVLSVAINKTGDVESVKLIKGDPLLAPAAIEAVKQWKYRPYILNGEPVNVETTATIQFTLAER